MKDFKFTFESNIHSDKQTVWNHITQMKNVNDELMPFARMTYPSDKAGLNVADVPLQTTLIKSVILLFGFIPVDLHYLKFDAIKNGEYFHENSTTLMHRYWKHHRTLIDKKGNVAVRDEISFQPRLHFLGYALLPVYRIIFRHRHKKLIKFFA